MNKHQFDLGASLYVPATQSPDALVAIGNGEKYPFLRSIIYCTEDAVRADQLSEALQNLRRTLPRLNDEKRPMRFIRVRNPHVLGRMLATHGIEKVDGFVLPKLTCANLLDYANQLSDQAPFLLMPTLETEEVFDYREMNRLRRMLQKNSRLRERILCLRVGGNDLLQCLGVRRNPTRSIYDSPIGCLISRLAGEFIPYGFGLTAPVFESMAHNDVLADEVECDLDNGLFGKTAIHPDQVAVIEAGFKVSPMDLEEACRIVAPDAPAVFRMNGRMCEPATHARWAEKIIRRYEIYGVKDQ
ncbi:MAG: HpcH/HpaI aldolase/citrate lyase family protein [Cyanobacteria bacterium REEB67]|nr:HpcH/HpaI aldolase/citrate lyase family protein [Cyanobacteria bacterium REEB67]